MKQNIKNRNYKIKESIAYYILGYQRYRENIKEIEKNHWIMILKFILETARDEVDTKEIIQENKDLLNKIQFSWNLSADEFIAYATCVFYVLTNREKEITSEKIVTEFLSEIYKHHPRKIMKEANFILDEFFPEEK